MGHVDSGSGEQRRWDQYADDPDPPRPPVRRGHLWVLLGVLAAALVVMVVVIVRQAGGFDPYRPGTTHAATMDLDDVCSGQLVATVTDDGRTWVATGAGGLASTEYGRLTVPAGWAVRPTVAGTLRIDTWSRATFVAEDSSGLPDVSLVRWRPGVLRPGCVD